MNGLEPQRLLNRAVRTSLHNSAFMREAHQLAEEQPRALLLACVSNACMDEAQAELMCGLLVAIPELSSFCVTHEGENLLCVQIHTLLAKPLPPSRQRAALLLLARLTQPADLGGAALGDECVGGEDDPERICSPGNAQPLLDRSALLERVLLPLLEQTQQAAPTNGTDGVAVVSDGMGGEGLGEAMVGGHGPGGEMATDTASYETDLGVLLRSVLQLLSARALMLTAQQLVGRAADEPLHPPALGRLVCQPQSNQRPVVGRIVCWPRSNQRSVGSPSRQTAPPRRVSYSIRDGIWSQLACLIRQVCALLYRLQQRALLDR